MRLLQDRAHNRAYDGAPPTVPHPIDQLSSESCLACHEHGLVVGDRKASAISHPLYTNCIQCHAGPSPSMMPMNNTVVNEFVGHQEQGGGDRAWQGAPLWCRTPPGCVKIV